MYASVENKHFFTKKCHHQPSQNYEQSQQQLGSCLENKVLQKSKFSKKLFIKVDLLVKYFLQKKNHKDSVDFWWWKMTLKVKILQTLRRLFIMLVGLMMTWFRKEMLIFNICRSGLMPNLFKESWTVSTLQRVSILAEPSQEGHSSVRRGGKINPLHLW